MREEKTAKENLFCARVVFDKFDDLAKSVKNQAQ